MYNDSTGDPRRATRVKACTRHRITDHDGTGMMSQPEPHPKKKPRYFERPDPDTPPLSLFETVTIVLSSHLGVRSAEKRQSDFRRANGLHVFIAGITYFLLVILGLILLVRAVTR
jgi:hypothetical protein